MPLILHTSHMQLIPGKKAHQYSTLHAVMMPEIVIVWWPKRHLLSHEDHAQNNLPWSPPYYPIVIHYDYFQISPIPQKIDEPNGPFLKWCRMVKGDNTGSINNLKLYPTTTILFYLSNEPIFIPFLLHSDALKSRSMRYHSYAYAHMCVCGSVYPDLISLWSYKCTHQVKTS